MRIRRRVPKWNRILCSLIPGIIAGGGSLAPAGNGLADPFYADVVANLHFDGTDGSTTFVDQKGHTFTGSGNAQIDTAQSRFGGASLLLDGTDDYVTSPDHADWAFGAGDWTVECWVRFNGDPGTGLMTFVSHYNATGNQRGWAVGLNNNTLRLLYSTDGSATTVLSAAWNPATAVWYYVTVVRRGTLVYFFVDGILLGSSSIGTATIFDSSAALQIGTQGLGADGDVNGWMDDVRITRRARYTTNFSRPARAHGDAVTTLGDEFYAQTVSLAHFNTTLADQKGISWTASGNAAIDSSQSVFGGASLHLDGTGDWIEATHASLAFGTADFTIECWVRYDTLSGNNFAFTWGGGWGVYTFSGQWAVFDGAASNAIGPAGSVSADTWYHIAVCRRGTSMRLFVDGVQVGSTATNSTNFSSTTIRIGAQPAGTGTTNGWIDDFRATTFARYVGSGFQFPMLAFADRAGDPFFGDVISINHWDGADGATTYTDEIVGRTWTNGANGGALDTANKQYGASSVEFLGTTNNQINSDSGAGWGFATNDFTIEFWLYVPSNAGTLMFWDQRGAGNAAPCIFQQSGSLLYFVNAGVQITVTTPIVSAAWQHIALSRNGTNTRLFHNGVQVGSTWTADTVNYVTNRVRLGTNGDTGGGFGTLTGSFDDIRVTNGVARYKTNFSPPPAAFLNAA